MLSGLAAGAATALGGALLGGGDAGGVRTRRMQMYTPEQMEVLQQYGETVAPQIGEGIEPYPGQIAAGPSPLQDRLFSVLGHEQRPEQYTERLRQFGEQQMGRMPTGQEWREFLPGERPDWERFMPERTGDFRQFMPGDFDRTALERAMEGAREPLDHQRWQEALPDELRQWRGEYDPAQARREAEMMYQEPARQAFHEDFLRDVGERFAGAGALRGSGFDHAVAEGARRMATDLGAQMGQHMAQDRQFHDQMRQQQRQLAGQLGAQDLGQQLTERQFQFDVGRGDLQQQLQEAQLRGQLGMQGLGHELSQEQLAAQIGMEGIGRDVQHQQMLSQLGMQGLGMEAQAGQTGMTALQQALGQLDPLMQGGQMQRGIEQEGLQAEMQRWQMAQPWANPWLEHTQGVLAAQPYQYMQQQQQPSTMHQIGSGLFTGGIGLGSQLLGTHAMGGQTMTPFQQANAPANLALMGL